MTKPQLTFSTRSEAEQYIAENGLAGKKKAQRAGGPWMLVANPEGTISRSVFIQLYKVERKNLGHTNYKIAQVVADAVKLWNEIKDARR